MEWKRSVEMEAYSTACDGYMPLRCIPVANARSVSGSAADRTAHNWRCPAWPSGLCRIPRRVLSAPVLSQLFDVEYKQVSPFTPVNGLPLSVAGQVSFP